MSELALASYLFYLALAFGLRSWLQVRRTGRTGFVGIAGRPGSAEWLGGVLFVVAIVLGVAAPAVDLMGAVESIRTLDGAAGHVVGIVLTAVGLIGTLAAQVTMGSSWRIGVDTTERTELVTTGLFSLVRNPIFAAMLPTAVGLALLVPNWLSLAGFVALFAALELQTRIVEEPYLIATHGDSYASYAARVGRFLPGVGRLQ